MGIFQRLSTVIKSNVNDAISKAEDPEKMLTQLIIDMSEQYSKAKNEVARAIADEKRLKKEYEVQLAKSEEWTKKAELAVNAGNDTLAMEALKRKNEYDSLASRYKSEWEGQKNTTEGLKTSLRGLSEKIEEAKRKKTLLVARAKRAKAQSTINKTMAGLNDTSAFDTFNRMEEKVDNLEFEADASEELDSLSQKDELEEQFKALGSEDASVEDELAALKAKLGK
ncbi:MAG: PspA/IM30 family protein [Clostridium sp.]|uniref:PspA/IM30 family protein n=1 Tax=Clostridium TaxID=1485 RepID=UPI0021536565|nr:PspA/IM30 family protein [Clostridium sp. LY3-2]MCR6516197.1 PspA/IM30 family protein [Clostridium sp. LY3-2]